MRKVQFSLVCYLLLCGGFLAEAQQVKTPTSQTHNSVAAVERELTGFFDSYAEDLRASRRAAIANRYDPHGYFRMGNGSKTFVSFEAVKNQYLTDWTGPKSFEWKDLSIEVLSPNAAVVTGLFDWQNTSGWTATQSYTALLIRHSGKWRIRVEDESVSPVPWTIRHLVGDRSKPGPFKYSLRAPPGASIAAHRHSVEMRVSVISGRVFILMGELATARVQRFDAGLSFVIPARVWHVEWWEAETQVEVEGNGPMLTEMASPTTPRTP